ncbi:hypothetical protein NJC40_00150 [Pseudomonas sp. 21LCFQ02]|nr:hypothetical protein [Pseudomonas sp. 21LCFQ02]
MHGLSGSSGTWDQMIQVLCSSPELDHLAYDCYEYPSSLWRIPFGKKMASIQEISEGLRTFISTKYNDRKVIIVAHSLGGVIARHYILESKKCGRDHQVMAAVLYASPLAGAALANIAKGFSWRHAHLTQLTVRGDILTSLNSDWVALRLSEDVTVLSVIAGSDAIVSRESALPYIGDQNTRTLIECGHIDVTKPSDASDLRFQVLKEFLNRFSPDITSPERCKTPTKLLHAGDVLFDVYTEQVEPHYVHRREDEIIKSAANSSNIWINGPAGVGKTAALRRLASREGWVFHHQILDGLRGLDARHLMREICNSLYEKSGHDIILPREISDIDLRKAFRKVFDLLAKNTTLAVLIEEIPLEGGEEYVRFVEHCYQLALLCESMNDDGRVIWLFSSIRDPLKDVSNVSAKLREKIQFINFTVWNEQDLSTLVGMINHNLDMQLTPDQAKVVTKKAQGSPRFVKLFFRRTRNEVTSNHTIDELLSSVHRDLVV